MGIGTSDGNYYDDEFHATMAEWNPDYDLNNLRGSAVDDGKAASITIKPVVEDRNDMTKQLNTPLDAGQQADYNTKFSPKDSYDYDMQGWYKANPDVSPNAEGVHYPDTFKKPNHPTFSDQSQYSNDMTPGGKWEQQQDKSYTFTPGPTNRSFHSTDELKQYFEKVEPTNKLMLPEEQPYNGHPIIDKLFGINGQERYKTWPEQAIREIGSWPQKGVEALQRAFHIAGKVAAGEVPMWEQDPVTGEFHTSIEGMEHARELVPLAMGGQIPLRIQLGQPSKVTTLRSMSQKLDEEAAIRRGGDGPGHPLNPVEAANRFHNLPEGENVRFAHQYEEHATNSQFEEYERLVNEPHRQVPFQTYEEAAAESHRISQALGHSGPNMIRPDSNAWRQFEADMNAYDNSIPGRTHPDQLTQRPYTYEGNAPIGVGNWRRVETSAENRRLLDAIRDNYAAFSDKTKSMMQDTVSEGQIHLARLKSPYAMPETHHNFKFFDTISTKTGHMEVSEIHDGKRLYVNGIGLRDLITPQSIGFSGIKDLLYALKKEFPEATEVAGFRVSGARKISGSGAAEAVMKLPTRPRGMGHNQGPPLED